MPPPRPLRLLFFLLSLGAAHASGWNDPLAGEPALAAYGSNNYRSVDANWSAAVAADGRIYVGNSAVLRFDGRNWTTIPIPGTYAIRALDADPDGRIWVGGVDELGYIANPATAPQFVSLRAQLDAKSPLGAVWNVYRLGPRIVFVCEQRVLLWDGKTFEVRELPAPRRLFSFRYRDGVVISQPTAGLWFTDGTTIRRFEFAGMEKEEVGWACDTGNGASLFITTKGLVRFDGRQASELNPELDKFLRQGLVTSAVELPNGFICIATFRSGAVVIDREGHICRILDRTAGLPGQELVAVCPARDHLVCVVGRRFVGLFDAGLNVTTFGPRNGLNLANPRIVVLRDAGHSFLLTDEALLKLGSTPTAGARWEQLSDGQFLDGIALGNGDFVFGGLRQVATWQPTGAFQVHREVNDVLCLAPLGGARFVAGIGSAVRIGRSGPAGPEWEAVEAKLPESVSDLVVRGGEIWAAMERGGIRVLDVDDLAALRSFDVGRELPATFSGPRFVRVGQRWLIRSTAGFFTMAGTKPEPVAELSHLHLIASERFPPEGSTDAWAIAAEPSGDGVSLLRLAENDHTVLAHAHPLNVPASLGRPVFLQRDNSGALWVVGAGGLVRLDAEALSRVVTDRPVLLHAVAQTARRTIALPGGAPWTLPADVQRLSLEFREEPEPSATPVLLQTRLVGLESSWQSSLGQRDFTHLPAGKYRFEVRLPGEDSGVSLASLVVLPPWYLAPWFLVSAVAAVAALLWFLVHLRLKQVAARNKALAALVESQTNELTKAVAAKSAFIAQLGHEIRNPLNGVVGLASTLQGLSLGDRESEIAQRIASCAGQLSSVVEDVLEFSLVEAGKVQLKQRRFQVLEPVQSAIFVCEAAGSVRPRLEAPGALTTERPRIGDPDRIRQILANYLENARKYARGTEIVVSVKTEADARVVFCVADNGPGISSAELSQLFERFSRGEDARRRGIPGTGLGLAACRAYATAMGGTVWAESDPGHGSRFFLALNLPFATTQHEAPTVANDRLLEGWSVFVVDDHDYNLFVLSDILDKMGAMTRTAESMTAALRLFDSALPDLIFLDVDLGTESGITLARHIRDSKTSYRDVPIIATSAFELDDVREGCLKAGMNAFVSKPITAEKVRLAVRQIESLNAGGLLVVAEAPVARGRSNLDLLSDGDPATRERVVTAARRALAESAEALAGAAANRDLAGIRRHAHAITSAALTIDLARVASLARETERCARRGAVEDSVENVAVLLATLKESGTVS